MTSSPSEATRIFLWMVPRTCSTVFSKFMTFVDDVDVWMEPYMACHFNQTYYNPNFMVGDPHVEKMRETLARNEASEFMTGIRKKMKEEIKVNPNIIDQKEISYSWVKQQLEMPTPEKKFIFIKDQTLAILNRLKFLPNVPCRHSFIIRHPMETYTSFKEMIRFRIDPNGIDWDDCHLGNDTPFLPVKDFYQIQYKLWKYLLENSEVEPVIIDAHDLMTKPEVILPKFFEKLGIPFKESYLEWEARDDFAQKWKGSADFVLLEPQTIVYSRAVKSTRFEASTRERGTPSKPEWKLTPELKEYIEGALPFYEEMYERRLH